MFDATVSDGVLRLARPDARWLSTGFDGGERRADAAYNVTVPEGWDRTDLADYVTERRADAGFDADGPALLTGVSQRHARVARRGPATAVATAGLSNPAPLFAADAGSAGHETASDDAPPVGTVNVFVGVERSLAPGALSNLVAVAASAKAATLSRTAGFPGTTTDAVVAACGPDAERARFSGTGTAVGAAARACVRDAVRASLDSRYANEEAIPDSVADARHGVAPVPEADVEVFEP